MTLKAKAFLIAGCSLLTICAFAGGLFVGMRLESKRTAQAIVDIQAMLALNRILDNHKLESLLKERCLDQALKKLDILIDQDKKLIASSYISGLSDEALSIMSHPDPNFVTSLNGFKSKYGDAWTEPSCRAVDNCRKN